MMVVVITGGLGAGKSLASAVLRSHGAEVIDLDEIACDVIAPGGAAFDDVVAAFGSTVQDARGTIDRQELARLAFASAQRTARLNRITHPAIARECERRLAGLRAGAVSPGIVVVEVPLLAEAPEFALIADATLAISANPELRVTRAVASGWDEADVRARIARQASDAEREALADHVIVNDGSREEFIARVEEFARSLAARGDG